MTEAELVDRAGSGDPRAIRELYERHAALVLTVVRRVVRDEDQARDCAQEAWIRALRGLSTFEGRSPFAAWLRRIAVRVALQAARASTRRSRREARFSEEIEDQSQPAGGDTRGDRLQAALSSLPQGMRRVLVLHDVEGFTHEEIGELLEISPGTSKSQLFKARGKIREIVKRYEDTGGNGGEEQLERKSGPAASPENRRIERRGVNAWST